MPDPRRLIVAAGLAIAAAIGISSDAASPRQAPAATEPFPDFSGKWILDGPPGDGPWRPFGSRFTATQTRDALTIQDFVTFAHDIDGAPLPTEIGPSPPRVIKFNVEERTSYQLAPPNLGPTFGMATSEPMSTVTRTGWAGDHLIITSHTVSRTTAPTQTPPVFETRDTDQLVVSFVGRNRMLVEQLRIDDPVPWEVSQYTPVETIRTFYNREGATDVSAWTETPRVSALRKKAEAGDSAAELALGQRYSEGNDVPKDMAAAVSWYRKAATHGSAKAEETLGLLYDDGIGVPKDPTRAAFWYRKAAEHGLASAQLTLGLKYEGPKALGFILPVTDPARPTSEGVPQDFKQATLWLRKAAEQGDATAQYYLADLFTLPGSTHTPDDFVQAVYWHRKAAEQGNQFGLDGLARAYEHGQGVAQDRVEALKWYILEARMAMMGATESFSRDQLKKSLTPQQAAEAQQRADVWLEAFEKRQQKDHKTLSLTQRRNVRGPVEGR
jgi:TPR repeat protein